MGSDLGCWQHLGKCRQPPNSKKEQQLCWSWFVTRSSCTQADKEDTADDKDNVLQFDIYLTPKPSMHSLCRYESMWLSHWPLQRWTCQYLWLLGLLCI